jgi:cytochrome d ubiquinol oxidase subunit I
MGLGLALLLAPLQLLIGDAHGLKTAEYQPAKLAAMEGHWDGSKPADLVLFGIPDEKSGRNLFEIGIPNLGSLVITHDWNGLYKGLNDFAAADRPPLIPPFFGFRIMVAIGMFLILLAVFGGYLWLRGQLFGNKLFLTAASLSWPLGFIAIIAGWTTTETGRQPWVATGLIRTADAVSPVAAGAVGVTLIAFLLVYIVIYSAGIYYINLLIRRGPALQGPEGPDAVQVAHRPISAASGMGGGEPLPAGE